MASLPSPASRSPHKKHSQKFWSGNILLFSILVHVLFAVGAGVWVVSSYVIKRQTKFTGPPPTPNPKPRVLEHRVQSAKKQGGGGSPAQSRRIVSSSVSAKVALPDLPTMPRSSDTSPAQMSGLGGAGMGSGFGTGMGSGIGSGMGSGGSGGGGINFFGLRSGKGGLVGTFYDLKQTKSGGNTPMTEPVPEVPSGTQQRSPQNMAYLGELKDFARGFNEAHLSRYFRAKQQLVTYQIFIPRINAGQAPAAFGVEKECKPKRWAIVYTGTIVPPRDGTFRFVGRGDDILIVRCNGRNVLDACWPVYQVDPGMNDETSRVASEFNKGKWITMRAGEEMKLEVVIGEIPGGSFSTYLCMEEKGVTKPGGPYPVFQVRAMPVPRSDVATAGTIVFGVREKAISALDALSQ
jgi:hypothetical protein